MSQSSLKWITSVVLAAVSWSVVLAADDDRPPERAVKLEYDSSTGQWIELPPPIPGTEGGDLAIAQQRLTRGDIKKAGKLFEKWIEVYGAGSENYPVALFGLADCEFQLQNYYKSHELLRELLGVAEDRDLLERVVHREFVIAEVFLSGKRRKILKMKLLKADDVALDILDDLSTNYRGSDIAELAIKTKADYFFEKGEFGLAEDEYARLAREFPRSRYLRYARLRSAQAALANFPGTEFDDAALIEAEERFDHFRKEFPELAQQESVGLVLDDIRNQRAEKEFSIGQYYERTESLSAAVFYYFSTYNNWPDTHAAAKAERRLLELGYLEVEQAGGEYEYELMPPTTEQEDIP